MQFDAIGDVCAELGESPVWDAESGSIWWVDIGGKRLIQTFLDGGVSNVWTTPEEVGFVVLTQRGGVIVGMERGLFRFDPADGSFDLCAPLGIENVRFNDATVDAFGRLWAGTMDMENTRAVGVLYLVGPDLSLTPVVEGMQTPNGLACDGGRLFISDSHPSVQTIWVAPLTEDGIGTREVFVKMDDYAGRPDGGAVDGNGNYWIAGVGGGVVHVFDPDGAHLEEHVVPVDAPTKPMFGGVNLGDLFLTSKIGDGLNGRLIKADRSPVLGRMVPAFITDN